MALESLPSLTFGQRFDAPALDTCYDRCCHIRTPFVCSLENPLLGGVEGVAFGVGLSDLATHPYTPPVEGNFHPPWWRPALCDGLPHFNTAPTRHGPLECGTLGSDHRHQFVPRFNERLRPFILKLGSQGVDVDSGLGELR